MMQISPLNCNSEITKWLDNAGKFPRLSAESINTMAKQIQALPADSTKRKRLVNKLVQHNLLLVVNFVKKFMDRKSHNRWGSPETLDYLQVGVLGLIRAAEKFDPCRGYTFSTYATFWMRSAVGRYNLKTITPVHVSESATRRLIYYRRNGKARKHGFSKPQTSDQMRVLSEQLCNAYQCISLDIRPTDGDSLLDMIPGRVSDEPITLDSVFRSLEQSGVDTIGLEILRLSFVEQKSINHISKQLGLSERAIAGAKQEALQLAAQHPELF